MLTPVMPPESHTRVTDAHAGANCRCAKVFLPRALRA